MLTQQAQYALRNGTIKIRVRRSGILQQLTFKIKEVRKGDITYTTLCTERILDTSELLRVAEEVGLPVESPNGSAFPKGKAASDFQNVNI